MMLLLQLEAVSLKFYQLDLARIFSRSHIGPRNQLLSYASVKLSKLLEARLSKKQLSGLQFGCNLHIKMQSLKQIQAIDLT